MSALRTRILIPVAVAAATFGVASTAVAVTQQPSARPAANNSAAANSAGNSYGGWPGSSDGSLSPTERYHAYAAVTLLQQAFNQHQPQAAADRFIDANTYIQHNPQAADGRAAFIALVKQVNQFAPQLKVDVKRTITQGDLVVVESLTTSSPTDRGGVEIDTFRFNAQNKIVEHWDANQAVAATSVNGHPQV